MIVICPNCATKFLVDPVALGPDGRRVRCARCSHIWFKERPPDIEMVPPQSFAPETETAAGPPPRNLPATAEQLLARRSTIAAGWVVLALVIVGLAAVAFVGRNQIVAFWPPALQLYDTLGIEVADGYPERLFGAGLSVRNVASEVVEEEGGDAATIFIRGEVVNESDVPRPVPPLMVRLVDDRGEALHEWVFAITDTPLPSGETEAFETSLREFDPSVTKLEILPADNDPNEGPAEPPDAGASEHSAEHPAESPAESPAERAVGGTADPSSDEPGHGPADNRSHGPDGATESRAGDQADDGAGHGADQAPVSAADPPVESPQNPPRQYPQAREFH